MKYTKHSEDEDISKIFVQEIYEMFKVEAKMIFTEENKKRF